MAGTEVGLVHLVGHQLVGDPGLVEQPGGIGFLFMVLAHC